MSAKKNMPHMDQQHLEWHKSSHSGGSGCIEVAQADGAIALRDSKAPNGPVMKFTKHEWSAFMDGVRDGEFDHMV